MQFTFKLTALLALATIVGASPTAEPNPSTAADTESGDTSPMVMSHREIRNWIRMTKGEFTFIGEPFSLEDNPLASRDSEVTTVVFCSNRNGNDCNPPCTTFTGANACLSAPNTNCLSATTEVTFCDRPGCGGSCNLFNSCGTRLNNNFCFTPGTASIRVP